MPDDGSSAVAFPGRQRWFAARCKTAQENVAKENLERQGFGVYLPMIKIGRKLGRYAWREFVEPLFPRYVFVRFDPARKSAAPLRCTKGVLGLVRFGPSDPTIIPDEVIEALKARENSAGLHVDKSARFLPGDKVEVLDGPFSGMIASMAEADGDGRVVLLLQAIGGLNRVTLPRAMVQRVTA